MQYYVASDFSAHLAEMFANFSLLNMCTGRTVIGTVRPKDLIEDWMRFTPKYSEADKCMF